MAIEAETARVEAITQVQRLGRAFGYYTDKGFFGEAADLFTDNGTFQWGNDGVYRGKARIRELLTRHGGGSMKEVAGLPFGRLNLRMQLQPVVTVSADGNTAQARWREWGLLGQYKKEATWGDAVIEDRYVREAGVTLQARVGAQIDDGDWDFFYRCYVRTYREHHSTPYLSRDFFARMAREMPDHWLLFIASQDDARIGCSLVALDPDRRVAYGRYWGALAPVRCLHFEACYYAPLQWCIDNGYLRFEGGAQGEHKMARGLEPVRTYSSHWLAHPAFSDAVARFLEREGAGVEAYVDELEQRTPFKRPG